MKLKPIITLKDFPKKETYIYLEEDYKNSLLNKAIKREGSQRILAEKINKSIKDLKIKQSSISLWLKRNNLRLDIIYWLLNYLSKNFDESQIKGIKGSSTTKMIFNPKLSIYLSTELANLVGKLYCDGSIQIKKSGVTRYNNKSLDLTNEFKKNLTKVFGKVSFKMYTSKINLLVTTISSFIGRILYYKFELNRNKIPNIILQSNKEVKSAYLRAVFDDEGTVHKTLGQIRLKMKYKSYLKDIKTILEKDFEIYCSKINKGISGHNKRVYFFQISGQYNLKKFYNEIGLTHPEKFHKLRNRLNNIKLETWGYNAKEKVYQILKEKGPMTTKELSKILPRDRKTIYMHLTNLKKQNKVTFIKIKRKFVYEYLWKIKNVHLNRK